MADKEVKLLYYTGKDLGREPQTLLRGGVRGIKWNLSNRRVRAVPMPDADDLLFYHPESFVETLTAEAAAVKWSIKAERMAEMAAKGIVTGATYYPKDGDPGAVIVLDEGTTTGIAKERKRAAKAADKG